MDPYYIKHGHHNTYIVSCYFIFDELGELLLECIFILILKGPHVVGNMLAKDVVSVDLGTEFSILAVITRESLGTVEESNCSLLQQFITLRKSDISMNALIIIQAFYFNLSMIKQMENNLPSTVLNWL